jgi:hypothetical protein
MTASETAFKALARAARDRYQAEKAELNRKGRLEAQQPQPTPGAAALNAYLKLVQPFEIWTTGNLDRLVGEVERCRGQAAEETALADLTGFVIAHLSWRRNRRLDVDEMHVAAAVVAALDELHVTSNALVPGPAVRRRRARDGSHRLVFAPPAHAQAARTPLLHRIVAILEGREESSEAVAANFLLAGRAREESYELLAKLDLSRLTDRERMALELRLEHRTFADVGRRMGVSKGTAQKLASRGATKLKTG